jgi:hypothetical protein
MRMRLPALRLKRDAFGRRSSGDNSLLLNQIRLIFFLNNRMEWSLTNFCVFWHQVYEPHDIEVNNTLFTLHTDVSLGHWKRLLKEALLMFLMLYPHLNYCVGVGGQYRDPTALTLGKALCTHWVRFRVGARSDLDAFEKGKITFFPFSNHNFPNVPPIPSQIRCWFTMKFVKYEMSRIWFRTVSVKLVCFSSIFEELRRSRAQWI